MAGASIEATLELWASALREVKSPLHPLFRAGARGGVCRTVSRWAAWG